jgi:hypothetical protein
MELLIGIALGIVVASKLPPDWLRKTSDWVDHMIGGTVRIIFRKTA